MCFILICVGMFHIFLNIFDIFIYMFDMLIDISICLLIYIYILDATQAPTGPASSITHNELTTSLINSLTDQRTN